MKTDPITIRIMESSDIKNIVEALNDAFSQYNVSLAFGDGKLEEMIYLFDIEPECSIVSLENEQITGVILAGRRGNIAHIGPMGVIRKRQGAGLGKKLMEFALKHLEKMGAEKVILEVIADNHRARRLYESCGFLKTRVLRCYRAKRKDMEKSPFIKTMEDTGRFWQVREMAINAMFADGMISPDNRPWQRDPVSIIKQKEHLKSYTVCDESIRGNNGNKGCSYILAYLLISDYGIVDMDSFSDNIEKFISKNLYITKENDDFEEIYSLTLKSIYMELILRACGTQPVMAFKNVTPEEHFTGFALSFGFENYLNQFEMEYIF